MREGAIKENLNKKQRTFVKHLKEITDGYKSITHADIEAMTATEKAELLKVVLELRETMRRFFPEIEGKRT